MDNFEEIKNLIIDKYVAQLQLFNNDIDEFNQPGLDSKIASRLNREINKRKKVLLEYKLQIENMRENKLDDIKEREKLINVFPGIVKRMIPEEEKIVFYPVKNIASVYKLIDKGIISRSYDNIISDDGEITTRIKIVTKDKIQDACLAASYPRTDYMPYGAIFVLKRSKDDLDSETIGQINFKTAPERLYGIITTKENINRLKKMCEEYGVDSTKVYTQEQFLLKCDEWFRKKEEEKKSRWGRL